MLLLLSLGTQNCSLITTLSMIFFVVCVLAVPIFRFGRLGIVVYSEDLTEQRAIRLGLRTTLQHTPKFSRPFPAMPWCDRREKFWQPSHRINQHQISCHESSYCIMKMKEVPATSIPRTTHCSIPVYNKAYI
jgi:hypothetical protein